MLLVSILLTWVTRGTLIGEILTKCVQPGLL